MTHFCLEVVSERALKATGKTKTASDSLLCHDKEKVLNLSSKPSQFGWRIIRQTQNNVHAGAGHLLLTSLVSMASTLEPEFKSFPDVQNKLTIWNLGKTANNLQVFWYWYMIHSCVELYSFKWKLSRERVKEKDKLYHPPTDLTLILSR